MRLLVRFLVSAKRVSHSIQNQGPALASPGLEEIAKRLANTRGLGSLSIEW